MFRDTEAFAMPAGCAASPSAGALPAALDCLPIRASYWAAVAEINDKLIEADKAFWAGVVADMNLKPGDFGGTGNLDCLSFDAWR
jgi:hypothetical protein